MKDGAPIVALEVGTSSVRALVAQAREDDHLMIIGLGECESSGVRKGEIADLERAVSCARVALQRAEDNAEVNIGEVYLLVSGAHFQSTVHRGSIPVLGQSREIMRDDVEHVIDAAKAINLTEERYVMHSICQHFYVDGQGRVINPVGLEGSRLDVDMLMLHCHRLRLRNAIRVAKSVPVDVKDYAFSGLCAALGALSPEDKENGVLLIDLGGGTTTYVAYAGSAIAAAGSLGLGGDHLTNDLAKGLRIPQFDADRMKKQYGSASVDPITRAQKVEMKGDGGSNGRFVRLGDLQLITSLRVEEILGLVKAQIGNEELLHHLGSGVVFTGGGAYLKNLTKLGEKVFGLPCQVGRPRDVSGLATAVAGAEYAAPIGLLRYAMRTARRGEGSVSLSGIIKRILGM